MSIRRVRRLRLRVRSLRGRLPSNLLRALAPRLLVANPALHFFETEVGWSMDYAESRRGSAGAVRHARQTLALANHTVFQVPYVDDAIPVSASAPFQLQNFVLEKLAVQVRGLWG